MILLSSSGILLIAILLVLWYSLTSLRAKEIAQKEAVYSCKKYNLQFLDETVTLQKIKLIRREDHKVVFFRRYEFEYTNASHERLKSFIIMYGYEIKVVGLDDNTIIYFAHPTF